MRRRSSRRQRARINPRSVTAVVLARDEARNIGRVLDSLPPQMPVLVIDHESHDDTARIAKARGATVLVRRFEGFVDARRFALTQVRTAWTLMIDADEMPDGDLAHALINASETPACYYVSRSTFFCGRALRMWRGERLLRLFKTGRARVEAVPAAGGSAQLHERWICDGPSATLPGTLLHNSYPTVQSYREKFERYTSIEARGLQPSRRRWIVEALRSPARFVWYAIARGAALDGAAGLHVAWHSALYPAVVRKKALRNRG